LALIFPPAAVGIGLKQNHAVIHSARPGAPTSRRGLRD